VPASNCEVVFRNGTLDRSCRLTNGDPPSAQLCPSMRE
jgi:hypothetical protein